MATPAATVVPCTVCGKPLELKLLIDVPYLLTAEAVGTDVQPVNVTLGTESLDNARRHVASHDQDTLPAEPAAAAEPAPKRRTRRPRKTAPRKRK